MNINIHAQNMYQKSRQMVVEMEVLSACTKSKQVTTDEVHQKLTVQKFTNDKNLAHLTAVVPT